MADSNILPKATSLLLDKIALRQSLEARTAKILAVPAPTLTPRQVRELMLSEGVWAEDNIGSRGIIAMREERDCDEE